MQLIRFTTHLPNAKTPTQGSEQAAGFDLYAAQITMDIAGQQLIVDTGLKVAFNPRHVLLIYGRSGLATKFGIRLTNGVGVVDADYRGPLMVILRSDKLGIQDFMQAIKPGDRIAQAVLTPIPGVVWHATDELDDTTRGEGGFGSSGSN